jgi:hypothetical protein
MFEQHYKRIPGDKESFPLKMINTTVFAWTLTIAAVYFGIAGLSLFFAFEPTNISPVWPPAQ